MGEEETNGVGGLDGAGADHLHLHVFIEITNHCNFHCSFCTSDMQSRAHGLMDMCTFQKACDDVVEGRIADHIALHLMGEPFLHPKMFDFLEYADRKGLRVILNTNCSLLTEERVKRLLDTLHGALLLSVQTPDQETFRLRGAPQLTWEAYLEGIRLTLRSYLSRTRGTPGQSYVELHMLNTKQCKPNAEVINTSKDGRDLINQWAQIVAGVEKEIGLDFSQFRKERLGDLGDPLAPDRHGLAYELAPGILLRFKGAGSFANYRTQPGTIVIPRPVGFCPIPSQQLAVLWNGDVTLCCLDFDGEIVVGNLKDKPLREIWAGEEACRIRDEMSRGVVTPPICQHCLGEVIPRKSLGQLAREVVANYRHGGIVRVYKETRGFVAKRLAARRQARGRAGTT